MPVVRVTHMLFCDSSNHRDLERPNRVNNEDLVHMPSITTIQVCIVVIDGIWTKSSLFTPLGRSKSLW